MVVMSGEWLTTGAFARRTRLSAKALRIYANGGVLVPLRVDPSNGYRNYHLSQLRDARLVRMLRRAGVPLALVAQILEAPRETWSEAVDSYRDELERTYRYRSQLISHLSHTLSGGKETYPMMKIMTRDVPAQTVLTEQAHVNALRLGDWIVQAGRRQIDAANAVRRQDEQACGSTRR